MTFKIILLKIDRPPTLLAHLHILFVVGKVFVIKRKTMAHTKETIKKWKQEFFWLLFTTAQKLICAVGTSQKEIINETFIAGSTNYQLSSLGDHSKSESLQCVVQEEEHNKALREKSSVPLPKILHNVPADYLFQWVWKTWERKRSRQWKNPQMTSFCQFSRPDQTWKVAWWKVFWGKWEWECLQRFYISAYFFLFFEENVKKAVLLLALHDIITRPQLLSCHINFIDHILS